MKKQLSPLSDIRAKDLAELRGWKCEGSLIFPDHVCFDMKQGFHRQHAMYHFDKNVPELNCLMNYLLLRACCNVSREFENYEARHRFYEMKKERYGDLVDEWIDGLPMKDKRL